MSSLSLTLAVLSDPHVGLDARAHDLCPIASPRAIETDFQERFLRFVRDRPLRADYLVCPGDATSKAETDEFTLAGQFLSEVAKALGVAEERILFIPGNHDVNWALINSLRGGGGRELRYHPMVGTDHLIADVLKRASGSLVTPPFIAHWEYPDLLVVAHNSSWHDDPSIALHTGLISHESIQALDKLLTTLDTDARRLRVFLIHHHPVQYDEIQEHEPDVSILTNADAMRAVLRKHHFDLLIHGHKHRPAFKTEIIDSEFPLALLAAGSFSILLDGAWAGEVQNQFHVVRIDQRDEDTGCICGEVESFAFVHSKGWVESSHPHGIPHRRAFGSYMLPAILNARLQSLVKQRLANRDYVRWDELITADADLRFLPERAILAALRHVAQTLNLTQMGDSPANIVLLGKRRDS